MKGSNESITVFKQTLTTLIVFVLMYSGSLSANEDNNENNNKVQKILFPEGQNSVAMNGHVAAHESYDYLLSAKKGQAFRIILKSTNRYNVFNIMEPGEKTDAFFNGSLRGTQFQGVLSKEGVYTIRVYLMDNAAHRDEHGQYTLEIERQDVLQTR